MTRLAALGLAILFGSAAGRAAAAQETWRRAIAEQSWDPIDRRFSAETVAALGRLASTRELLAFVRRHRIDLAVVEPGDKLPMDALGSYVDGDRRIYINREDLMSGVLELRKGGTPEDAIAAVLAWKFLPTVVHEIRHGMTRQRLREREGLSVRLSPLESETISFLEEAKVFREEVRVRPELWSDPSRILEVEESTGRLLQALDKDVESVRRMVRRLYHGRPALLETPREALIGEYRRRRAVLLGGADELLRADTSSITDPDVRADFEELAWSVADGLSLYNEILAVLEDPRSYARFRRFYASELEGASRAAERARR